MYFMSIAVADIALEQESNENMVLPGHPTILELQGKCVDETQSLHNSTEAYSMAVPKCLHHDGNRQNKRCTLREYLDTNKDVLSDEERVYIFCQLLEGVAHWEQHIISHRDLKSNNILVDYNEGGFHRIAITEGNILLPDKVHIERGNSMLLAPEVIKTFIMFIL